MTPMSKFHQQLRFIFHQYPISTRMKAILWQCLEAIFVQILMPLLCRVMRSQRTYTSSWSKTGRLRIKTELSSGSMYVLGHLFMHLNYWMNKWLQGGPGCSSFDGAMMEIGPWRWDGKSEQEFWVKPGGWEEYATIVYGQFWHMRNSFHHLWCVNKVDQPAGTGFSYASTDRYVHTIDVVGWPPLQDASSLDLTCFFRLSNSLWNFWRTSMIFFQSTKEWMYVFRIRCLFLTKYVFKDLPCRRKFCRSMDPLLWSVTAQLVPYP